MANRRRARLPSLILVIVGLAGVALLHFSCSDLAPPPLCSEAAPDVQYCYEIPDGGLDGPPDGATPDAPADMPADLTADAPAYQAPGDVPGDVPVDRPADRPSDVAGDVAADAPPADMSSASGG